MSRLFRFGPFDFDDETRLLRREGRPTALSPKGADVLAVLLDAGKELVTKAELVERAWPDVSVDEGSLKVRVAEIRKALGDDASAPVFIETAAQRGYRFVGELEVEAGDPLDLEALERPLMAVVPFETDGSPAADRAAREIGDGITESMARWAEVRVIPLGRLEQPERARELGAAYRIGGSVGSDGSACRVVVRLLDGDARHLLWTESYPDLPVDDGAARRRLALEIGHDIRRSFHPRASRVPTSDVPTAWDHVLQGRAQAWRTTREANRLARLHYLRALEIDPMAAQVHADLVGVCSTEVLCGWSEDLDATLAMSRHHATRALDLDARSRGVRVAVAWDCCSHRESERALVHLDEARELGPTRLPTVFGWLRALALLQLGRLDEAHAISSELNQKALRHREGDLVFHLHAMVQLHRAAFEEAATAAECASAIRPTWTFDCTAAMGWSLSGVTHRAEAALARARGHRDDLSVDLAMATLGWMSPAGTAEALCSWLLDLGLPKRPRLASTGG
ncbi:MAG: winged helix-turn-helix domain-containing protein [Myxococcota bacterium]